MQKFKCLLFIDDDHPTNFYHQVIAKEANIADKLVFYEEALDAIDYLKETKEQNIPSPELIFLDINMPGIDGWEFLDRYEKEIGERSSSIYILTTSNNPIDKEKARKNNWVIDLMTKPLNIKTLQKLRNKYLLGSS